MKNKASLLKHMAQKVFSAYYVQFVAKQNIFVGLNIS